MKRFPRPVTLAILGSLALIATSAVIQAGHAWGSYHWARTSSPFTLKLGDNVSATWDGYLAKASADWTGTAPAVLQTSVVSGKTKPRNCRPREGRVEVCSAAYGYTGWLGLAQIWISGGEHIIQAITKVNDSYFNAPTYDTSDWRQFVMCQEIGHAFGLGHQDTDFNNDNLDSCMDYTSDPASNTEPNGHDAEMLLAIYAHATDTFNSYEGADDGGSSGGGGMGGGMSNGMGAAQSGGPPGLDRADVSEPGQWGRIIASSAAGRYTTHELDLGAGNRVVTHVIWAID